MATLSQIDEMRKQIAPFIRVTPTVAVPSSEIVVDRPDCEFVFKLELFQVTGTFKARGATAAALELSPEQRARGVTAISSGNHAIAVAFGARAVGTSAKVVMIKTASPARVSLARSYGAEVELAEDGPSGFRRVSEIEQTEGRSFIHPFEGPRPVTATGTLGVEFFEQAGPLDAVIVAIGGGGLIAGVAAGIKQLSPNTKIFGVEPEGANTMSLSFAAGHPVTVTSVSTIADSLAPPMATPYTYGVCRKFVDEIVLIPDSAMRTAMRVLFHKLKLCVEPAGAAALAAALGPLRSSLKGMTRVGIVVCGSNIDAPSFSQHLSAIECCHREE